MGNNHPNFCCQDVEEIKEKIYTPPILTEHYPTENLSLSQKSSRAQPSPLLQVEIFAKHLCQKHAISEFYIPLLSKIIVHDSETLFEKRLASLSQSDFSLFISNLNEVKLQLMDDLYRYFSTDKTKQSKLLSKLQNIQTPEIILQESMKQSEKEQLIRKGHQLIRQNKIAVVFMCAGSSSRYGPNNKFLSPFSLKNNNNIMDLVFSNLRRSVAGIKILPIIINCSKNNAKPIKQYLQYRNYYGFKQEYFRLTTSTSLVVLDSQGNYCLNEQFQLVKRAPGTAETAENLFSSEIEQFLKKQRITHLYFSGMENPLEVPCDPLLIGQVVSQKRKIGAKCVKFLSSEDQRLSRYYRNLNSPERFKINLLTPDATSNISKQAQLILPIAMNSLVIELNQLKKIVQNQQRSLSEPELYQAIKKQEQVLDQSNNQMHKIQCYSFERDLRNYLSQTDCPLLLLVDRKKHFLPVLTQDKQFSFQMAELVLKQMQSSDPDFFNISQ